MPPKKTGTKRIQRPKQPKATSSQPPAKRHRSEKMAFVKPIKKGNKKALKELTQDEINNKMSKLKITVKIFEDYRRQLQENIEQGAIEFTENEIVSIILTKGHKANVPAIVKHYQALYQLGFSSTDIAVITSRSNSVAELFRFFANGDRWWDEFKITQAELIQIASCAGAHQVFNYLKTNWVVLESLLGKENLVKVASHNGATLTLIYLRQNGAALFDLLGQEGLVKVSNHSGAEPTLVYLQHNWDDLLALLGIEALVKLASKEGAAKALTYLQNNWVALEQLLGKQNIIKLASSKGSAAKTLTYLQNNWVALEQLLGKENIIKLASKEGAAKAFTYLQNNWAALEQLLGKESLMKLMSYKGLTQTLMCSSSDLI